MNVVRSARFGIACRSRPSRSSVSRAVDAPLHPAEHAVVDVLQRHVEIRHDLLGVGQRLDQLVGEVDRVGVEDADPLQPVDLVQLAQQLGQPHPAVQVQAVIGRVLGDDDQLAHAVGGQFAGLAQHFLDRLGDVLAAHAGDGAEGAKPVAALRRFSDKRNGAA